MDEFLAKSLGFLTVKICQEIPRIRKEIDAEDVILAIVEAMPEPRIFVAEPTVTGHLIRDDRWMLAFDLVVTRLANEGRSVIDPTALWTLIRLHPTLAEIKAGAEHSLFDLLNRRMLIQEILLPEENDIGEKNPRIQHYRKKHNRFLKTMAMSSYRFVIEETRP